MLISSGEELFNDAVAMITHWTATQPITLMSISPPAQRENDVLETAARQPFDFAVLFLNNIMYNSGDRAQLEDDSVALVHKMVNLFRKPLIAIWTWPDSPGYATRLLNAGAVAALRAPYNYEDIQQALRKCIEP